MNLQEERNLHWGAEGKRPPSPRSPLSSSPFSIKRALDQASKAELGRLFASWQPVRYEALARQESSPCISIPHGASRIMCTVLCVESG